MNTELHNLLFSTSSTSTSNTTSSQEQMKVGLEEFLKASRLQYQAGMAHDHDAARRQAEASAAWRPEDYASYRPRKHVDSIVIEPKQLPGEST